MAEGVKIRIAAFACLSNHFHLILMNETMNQNQIPKDPYVIRWLTVCAILIFAMVILGGATRLTGSGLSMVNWHPINGSIPPMSEQAWEEEFNHYKKSPEFIKKNSHMNVDDFKGIFYFEYSHRMLGRLIGLVFFFPFLYFLLTKRIKKPEIPKYLLMLVLGGFQGLLGWYMVKSGLVNNPNVSQYRLTAHLMSAIVIYVFILWTILGLKNTHPFVPKAHSAFKNMRTWAYSLTALIFVTFSSGGFVAGLKAGLIFNTFPKMGEFWIPPGLFSFSPFYMNFFENLVTVQFNHRILAMTTAILVFVYWIKSQSVDFKRCTLLTFNWLVAAVALQVFLGIATLLNGVPIILGSLHQAGALVLMTFMVINLHSVTRY